MKRSMYMQSPPSVETLFGRAFEFLVALFSEVSTKDETARTEIRPIRSGGAGFAV